MKKHTTSGLITLKNAFGKQDYLIFNEAYKKQLLDHPLVNGLFTIGNAFVIVANTFNWEFELVTGQVEKVTGYTAAEIMDLKADFVMNFPLKEHLPANMVTVKSGMNYIHTRPLEERQYIFVVYYYQAFKKNGEVITVQHQSIPLVFDEQKIPFIFCNIYSDISYLNALKVPQGIINNKFTGEVFHVNFENREIEKKEALFTDREKEIIKCIKQGLTSRQIADLLVISMDTVRTHRKNIMRKAGVSNTATLINYTIINGIL